MKKKDQTMPEPKQPPAKTHELSDDELDAVSGGVNRMQGTTEGASQSKVRQTVDTSFGAKLRDGLGGG